MNRQKTQTSKKVKVLGTQKFINATTGEVEDFEVTSIEDRDFNFSKVWMRSFISTLDIVGNQKTRLCFYIVDHVDRENKLTMTYRQLADETGISLETVRTTMNILLDSDFLRRVNQGCYIINPDVVFKGTRNARMNILTTYTDLAVPKKEMSIKDQIQAIQASIDALQCQLAALNAKQQALANADQEQVEGQMSIDDYAEMGA